MASGQGFSQGLQRPYNGPAAPNFSTRRNNTSSPQLPQNPYKNEYPNQSPAYSQGRQNYSGSVRGNDFPPQDQEYYGGRKGLPIQRVGDSLDLVKRSASADGMRGGYNQRRLAEPGQEYQNGPAGRGKVSPLNIERSDTAGSAGPHIRRKPVKNAILSPEQTAWDNPFPTFPGAKKKTSQSEEQEILRKMAALEMGGTSEELPKDKPRKGPLESFANTGPSQKRNLPQGESVELRQGLPRSGYNSPAGNKIPVDKNYSERGYERAPENENRVESGLSERSHNTSLTAPPNQAHRKLPAKTANNFDFGLNGSQNETALQVTRQRNGSLGEIYNTYYQPEEGKRRSSFDVEMPNFDDDLNASHKKGNSFELHMQVPPLTTAGHHEIKPLNIQSDPYGPQLQSQINESRYAENGFSTQQDYDYSYDNGYLNESQPNQNYGPPINYDSYNEPHVPYNFDPRLPPNNYEPPPRSTSVLARQGFDHYQNVEREDFSNFSNGPYSNYAANFVPEDEQSMFTQAGSYSSLSGEQVNKKPVPIRNYGNLSSDQQFPQETPEDDGSLSLEPAPVTAAELDYLRNMIKMNPDDQATQLQLARRLVDASETLVKSIPDQRARNKARERYIMDAHKLLKKLIAQQNPDAMFYLADCYGRGALGLETDFKEAFSLYQSAAKLGHAAAAYRTAVCCELGNEEGGGTRKDPLKATQWYKRAAMLGDTPAMYKMGIVLLKGLLGQPRNPREAIGWLKRAAERADAENPHALHELALLYEQPQGTETSVIRDEAYSFQLFQQAADLGYKFSQFRLGCAYEYGLFNCPIDPRLSILWYSRAAAQGEHQSELALSGWYLTGSEGVLQQSDTEAYLWARKAAMAGLAKAEYAMGYFTEVGIGSPAKLEDAKRWYWRAASQNFPKARERLEDLKRGGNKAALRPREKISRSQKNPKEGLY